MTYSVKELFYTLQGEGARSGRPAVFCRFSGCNLWSGREAHRDRAICRFCDTDFVGTDGPGGGKFTDAEQLARTIAGQWPSRFGQRARPYVVFTGGEPLLQLDEPLIEAVHNHGFEIAVESNGTVEAPAGIDWLCISPKADAELRQRSGQELKLVYPQSQPEAQPARFAGLDFEYFYLQPLDNANRADNARAAVEYCLHHPQWHISVQTHKVLDIP